MCVLLLLLVLTSESSFSVGSAASSWEWGDRYRDGRVCSNLEDTSGDICQPNEIQFKQGAEHCKW